MNILNIIDTIYESKYFPTILIISIIVLVFLFIAVIILGLKDSKKSKGPKKEIFQDIKDITFNSPNDKETIKEDVTFEIPVLTKNLENFKKSLEEEIEREEKINVVKKESKTNEEAKQTKILDKKEIDNTSVIPVIKIDSHEENIVEKQEEEPNPPKREILKELFKNRKSKEIEPPKVKGDQLEDQIVKEDKKVVSSKKVQPIIEEEKKKKVELPKVIEQPKIEKTVVIPKKETKYSGDDDF